MTHRRTFLKGTFLISLIVIGILWWMQFRKTPEGKQLANAPSELAPAMKTKSSVRENKDAAPAEPQTPAMELAEKLRNASDEEWPALENEFWEFLLTQSGNPEARELIVHWIVMSKRLEIYSKRWEELLALADGKPSEQSLQWFLAETAGEKGADEIELAARKRIQSNEPAHLKRLARLIAKKGDYGTAAIYLGQATNEGSAQGLQLLPAEAKLKEAAGQKSEAIAKLDALMNRIQGGLSSNEEKESIAAVASAYRAIGENEKAANAYLLASEISQLDFRKERLLLESLKLRKNIAQLSTKDRDSLVNLSKNAAVDAVRDEASQLLK